MTLQKNKTKLINPSKIKELLESGISTDDILENYHADREVLFEVISEQKIKQEIKQ